MFHSGKLETLTRTVLQGNSAGQEGPAVMSIGSVKNMSGTTFANNTFFCPSGTYGFDLDRDAEEVRVSKPCLVSSPVEAEFQELESHFNQGTVFCASR